MLRKIVLSVLLALLLEIPAGAVRVFERTTVANLPTCASVTSGLAYFVTDGASTSDCSTGAGTDKNVCVCDGSSWVSLSAGGAAANSFETINAPSGTDPVADSSTDTLNLTSGAAALSITGTSGTDTIDFDIAGTASRCARFDGSGELVPASADCPSGMTGITLDIGDDGGNDSTAISEIATVSDTYSVITEPSADKVLIDFAKVPPYQQYDPNRPPSSCATCDEFTGDDDQLTWRWGNQGTATIAYELDYARIVGVVGAGSDLRVRWITGADGSATDWVATLAASVLLRGAYNMLSIITLASGTEATPTNLRLCRIESDAVGLDNYDLLTSTWTNYTTYSTNNVTFDSGWAGFGPFYIQMRYETSTKGLTCAFSTDGLTWYVQAASTLLAHPTTSIGFAVTSNSGSISPEANILWFRQRTDSAGISSPYPSGE